MSRFGLRSKTDGFKISEEKSASSSNDKKLCKSAKVELKRVNQKYKKSSLFTNDAQKVSPPSFLEKEALATDNKRTTVSLVCSLPLNRITGIIEKLKLTNSKPISISKSKSKSQNNEDDKNIKEELLKRRERRLNDDVDDEENDDVEGEGEGESGEYQKQHQQRNQIMKILCLYCDKQFTSLKMQLKHVDKFHTQHKDRRCSGRNSQTPPHELKKAKQQTSMMQNFPGCTFCKKTKASQLISVPAKELHGLFAHLTACHADRYFGCKACTLRFQNVTKLAKHMQSVHNESMLLPAASTTAAAVIGQVGEERSPMATKSNDNADALPLSSTGIGAIAAVPSSKRETKTRLQKSQKTQSGPSTSNASSSTASQQQNITALVSTTAATASSTIIGAEEPILSRLGLTQNRLPNNRARGVRLRRNGGGSGVEAILPEVLLKSDQTCSTAVTSASASSSLSASPLKARSGKSAKSCGAAAFSGGGGDAEVIFRVPTRTEILSCVFDDDFYKEVVSNVRSNLHEHLDGKLLAPISSVQPTSTTSAAVVKRRATVSQQQIEIRGNMPQSGDNGALHAATSLSATTAFPTLLTAQQYAGDGASGSSKIRRRPHTKHSWKWKWDSVKKFKLINEGGRIIKKMKQPLLGSGGLRDLSKLDMWTQLTMRQKHEQQHHEDVCTSSVSMSHWQRSFTAASASSAMATSSTDALREEKQRLNEQLNFILDMRLLPHIILEQNEQAIIKLENDYELGCGTGSAISGSGGIGRDEGEDDFIGGQSFTDARFLSLLQLTPHNEDARSRMSRPRLVLSGEWARPRCYLCMCCGAKFDKLKSLEEHKMFRHSHILSTHYEVVGRELLAANLLRHFFIPKRALSRYGRDINMPVASATICSSSAMRRFAWSKNGSASINIAASAEDESSDSLQSILHNCTTTAATHAYNIKNSATSSSSSTATTTDDCDDTTDTKNALILIDMNTASPSHSMQSSSSSSRATTAATANAAAKHIKLHKEQLLAASTAVSCSKCSRKCSGVLDLYRHMLDCSGDYIWSLAKKRKYRYYCGGSKKRRPCNKHHSYAAELRKQCKQKSPKTQRHVANAVAADTEESGSNCSKNKTPPRQRPSDAESIKKMLENLPAKRVCKKIFPTVTKTKKSMKSKLITKHKIFTTQVLRKTRARQISQASKILSKTKSQFPNKTVTAQGLNALKLKNKNGSELAEAKTLNDCPPSATTSIPALDDQDVGSNLLQMNNCQNPKEGEVQINEINKNDLVENVAFDSVQKSPNIKTCISNRTTTTSKTASNHQPVLEGKSEPPSTSITPKVMRPNDNIVAVIPTKSVNDNLSSKKFEQTVVVDVLVSQNTIPTTPTSSLSLDYVSGGPKIQISPQTENLNCNNSKKRSKKINDCIAMLTGKLEEKLKTEQKVVAGSTKEICPESEGKAFTSTLTSPEEKRTPKRKTTSRRFIKPDTLNAKLSLSQTKKMHPLTPTIVPAIDSVTPATTTKDNISVPMVTQVATPFPIPVSAAVSAAPVVPVPVTIEMLPKLPVYLPIKNFKTSAPPPATPLPIPLPLPAQPLQVESLPVNVPAALTLLHPPLPPLSLPPPPPRLQSMHFNVEPLNLSSSNIPQNISQDLKCSIAQHRPSMPARRQTICGFEAKNFIGFNEMEPLDLSKKSTNKEPAYPPQLLLLLPPPQARTIEITHNVPLELPSKNSSSEPTASQTPSLLSPASLTISLPPEILLNKQFYSNLDLLKIPQVRNPVYIPTQPTEMPNTSIKSLNTATTTITAAATTFTPAVATTPTPKKRNNNSNKNVNDLTAKPITTNHNSSGKANANLSTQKKDNAAKAKITHDEVVNNHIDDAINSVINAVTVSPTPDNAEQTTNEFEVIKLNAHQKEPHQIVESQKFVLHQLPSTATANVVEMEATATAPAPAQPPLKHLTPQKRSMRSKTLDCRPAALAQATANLLQQRISTPPPAPPPQPGIVVNFVAEQPHEIKDDAPMLNTSVSNKSSVDLSPIPDKVVVAQDRHTIAIAKDNATTNSTAPIVSTDVKINHVVEVKASEKSILCKDRSQAVEDGNKVSATIPVSRAEPEPESSEVAIVVEVASITLPDVNKSSPILPVSHDTNINSISEENISIINNTSSGFHSSGQSEILPDSKKKQRRRRKNELAAIVADQLLESFKIDKSRRDNLKKLENLAYEKSEDLLLTGMLLMSSTKRNASSAFPSSVIQTTTATTAVNDKAMEKNVESTKRQKAESVKNIKNKSTKSLEPVNNVKHDISAVVNTEKHVADQIAIPDPDQDKEKEVSDKLVGVDSNKEKDVDPKKSKRRQYRRRGGKALDNENISKLKSSLESFSIGIERQLTEMEAKNANVFNVTEPKTRNAVIAASAAAAKTSSILRPSILSASLEQPSSNPNKAQSSSENGKTVVASRDPRLNKNIHKDDDKETTDDTDGVQNASMPTKSRLRSATIAIAIAAAAAADINENEKNLDEIGDIEEDNYLTEIAKNVNEKINAEDEEFVFANDGFEMANDMQDDSNSKYYRPSTSMSVRSAPNFNDDRSDFGSVCDENTNTEVMDMDLDDDMSVYTSYSQDVGRGGRGRRRRRRRSILLKRRPKKRPGHDLSAEKFECVLCKKTFFTATSLVKHNMTLAHVSKVSELEYLQSKSMPAGGGVTDDHKQSPTQLASIPQHNLRRSAKDSKESATMATWSLVNNASGSATKAIETVRAIWGEDANRTNDCLAKQPTTETTTTTTEINKDKITGFNSTPRLTLNPDERLFFECCNILKGAETPRINNEDCNNGAGTYTYAYQQQQQDKTPVPCMTGTSLKPPPSIGVVDAISPRKQSVSDRPSYKTIPAQTMQPSLFRDPQTIQSGFNKHAAAVNTNEQNLLSANYSAISQFSAVTNTTSRFKTKAAMKGYENVNVNLTIQQELETKSRTVCKLTELAEIALGNEKPNSPEFSHHATDLRDESNLINTPDYNNLLLSVVDNQKDCPKNTETQSSSTSSKTIMHSSIIKAAVEEQSKAPSVGKIVIPDRPFKNIGLEEKETITFQKPKTVAVNLLTEDNNSVSTASYSDRDDFDFGSMSCDEDASIRTTNEKNPIKNNSSDSSSSRATAKTFENKSLIMGRIFKNASTKPKSATATATAVKFKSVGVQKDQTPKADLNQLFDELRGGDNLGKTKSSEATERKETNSAITEDIKDKHAAMTLTSTVATAAAIRVEQPAVATRTKGKDARTVRKGSVAAVSGKTAGAPKGKAKGRSRRDQKDISKMQTELGMSQQEIEKLIDEGQRKSKRRCATNRPKKVVEIWSSDEYEEFLSTKDIIALIEEKEKEESRKKRKNSINEIKEKDSDFSHMTTTITATTEKRKSLKCTSVTAEKKEKAAAAAADEIAFEFKDYKRSEKGKTTVAAAAATDKRHKTATKAASNKEKQQTCNSSSSSRPDKKVTKLKSDLHKSNQNNSSSRSNRLSSYKNIETAAAPAKTKFKTPKAVQIAADDVDADVSSRVVKLKPKKITASKAKEPAAVYSEDDVCLSNLAKRSNNRTSRNNKDRKDSARREDVNSLKDFSKAAANVKECVREVASAVKTDVVSKKRNSSKAYKCKRKTQANQSPPRRKRLATEKLYYWSSSSDEDFGRINTSDAQEFESGEQYQKHGWIVGDSHKKLVTLLAIAKGNKKVENCGVKKNISKKKS